MCLGRASIHLIFLWVRITLDNWMLGLDCRIEKVRIGGISFENIFFWDFCWRHRILDTHKVLISLDYLFQLGYISCDYKSFKNENLGGTLKRFSLAAIRFSLMLLDACCSLMLSDAQKCSLMLCDAQKCSLMIIKAPWCSLKLFDAWKKRKNIHGIRQKNHRKIIVVTLFISEYTWNHCLWTCCKQFC